MSVKTAHVMMYGTRRPRKIYTTPNGPIAAIFCTSVLLLREAVRPIAENISIGPTSSMLRYSLNLLDKLLGFLTLQM